MTSPLCRKYGGGKKDYKRWSNGGCSILVFCAHADSFLVITKSTRSQARHVTAVCWLRKGKAPCIHNLGHLLFVPTAAFPPSSYGLRQPA